MVEVWKPIAGYEGLYEVSNMGRVRSVDRFIEREGKGVVLFSGMLMVSRINKQGYCRIGLSDAKHKKKSIFVHRLVARAFPEICGEWFDGCVINHKDENPLNNVATNLEVCTQKHNCNYGNRNEKLAKHFEKPIKQIKDGIILKIWESGSDIQRKTGMNRRNIQKACNNDYGYKEPYGYKWEWA